MEFKYKLTDCLIGHSCEVTSLSIPPAEQDIRLIKYFVSGSKDGTVIVWNIKLENTKPKSTLFKVLKGHSDVVQKVAITHDTKYVISGSWDCNVCIWDIESGECIKTIKHQSKVMDISYDITNNIDYISSVQSNGMVMVWKLLSKTEEPIFHNSFHNESFFDNNTLNCCLLGTRTLCTAGSDNKIFNCLSEFNEEASRSVKYKSNIIIRRIAHSFQHKGGKINNIAHSPDYSFLASGCSEGELYIWSFNEPELSHLFHFKVDSPINNITFNPFKYWCIAANDNNIIIWNLESKDIIANIVNDDLGDINNENKNEIISKYKENWRDLQYHKTQLKVKKDQGILDKPFIRSLSIGWFNSEVFYVACDDGTIREYTIE
ncbi:hypothetical protein ACTFIU_007807 [Dictyostelium citrinum]